MKNPTTTTKTAATRTAATAPARPAPPPRNPYVTGWPDPAVHQRIIANKLTQAAARAAKTKAALDRALAPGKEAIARMRRLQDAAAQARAAAKAAGTRAKLDFSAALEQLMDEQVKQFGATRPR